MNKAGLIKAVIACLLCLFAGASACAAPCIVLLHGMARTADSMNKMALEGEGYTVVNYGYPSTSPPAARALRVKIPEGQSAP